MILKVLSRDSDACALFFARGNYSFGLLDARITGALTINIEGSLDLDIVKEGSMIHVFPERGFDHWYGLITQPPRYQDITLNYQVQALQLTGFLGEIASIATFTAPAGSQGEVEVDDWWKDRR